MSIPLEIGDEVRAALASGQPLVALESTIISHGMPWPENVETALRVEAAVRDAGAIPATVAIIGGRLVAGLDRRGIERIGKAGASVSKASRRDLPRLVASGADGATTVAATMIVAAMAGISVFATGGIGGVHRGAESSWDVSADLEELGRTPVCVVCAGAKAILDLPKTLEYLETRGVPVIGYRTDELPAFYSARSGIALVERADEPRDIALRMKASRELGFSSGMVVANPVPESMSMEREAMEREIEKALQAADDARVRGRDVTPFLLAKMKELTSGESLETNIALVLNNASLAAQIALAFSGLD
ncbi:MAG TPA: pseudouridine-5'-phosphate glycosidase [Rectinemataceae bacterium]|nr:pseudouridine-5'-phosphate glycosidase [Rectinemataceae bacterium]